MEISINTNFNKECSKNRLRNYILYKKVVQLQNFAQEKLGTRQVLRGCHVA